MVIRRRARNSKTYQQALAAGLSPFLAHIIAGRVPEFVEDIVPIVKPTLKQIYPPHQLRDADKAADRLATAIIERQRIGILTDYDVDGITSHALTYRVLTTYFQVEPQRVDSFIGHRLHDGYGITPRLTERILTCRQRPSVILTADCGSSDERCIAQLAAVGIDVIVTDHHALPTTGIPPSAYAVVNPSRADCPYPDKTIAGCMTVWLLLCRVRSRLIELGYLPETTPKPLAELDYVSLGTLADCVSIQAPSNRAVVQAGLQRLNQLNRPCWRVLQNRLISQRRAFTVEDLVFQIAPRINARSRLADPYAALNYLLAETDADADYFLNILDADNQQRKIMEQQMVESALPQALAQFNRGQMTLAIYLEGGHTGVAGIVAMRLVERFGRPTVVLSDALEPHQLTGSLRGVDEAHLANALQWIDQHYPNLLLRFGGHKGAAGLTIAQSQLSVFQAAFERAIREQLTSHTLEPYVLIDGRLPAERISLESWEQLEQLQPYGRTFERPLFENRFTLSALRPLSKGNIQLELQLAGNNYRAIWFRANTALCDTLAIGDPVHCVFELTLDQYRNGTELKLNINYMYKAEDNAIDH